MFPRSGSWGHRPVLVATLVVLLIFGGLFGPAQTAKIIAGTFFPNCQTPAKR